MGRTTRRSRAKFEVTFHAVTSEADIRDYTDKMEILITIYRVADDLLKPAVNLKWIQVITSGVNYLLTWSSLRKDIIVIFGRGIHGLQVSEMAFLLMLALNRNFPENVRNQDRRVWARWKSKLLFQKKVGILGIGFIGEEIARKGLHDSLRCGYCEKRIDSIDRSSARGDSARGCGGRLPDSRCTVHARNIQDRDEVLSACFTAFLINLARGELVDEEVLIEALETER
jgi:phosphoglycerate dehydrogenase-like enzyme